MKKHEIAIILGAFLILRSSATLAQITSLKEGGTLPDIVLDDLYNTNIKSLKTKDLKGKIIIIDFWNTWCSACVAGLPKLDKLQKKYKNDIVVLPVTDQPGNVVSKFWKANAITRKLDLLTVVQDTIFRKLFPHVGVPHMVWIDRNGKFISATRSEYANEKEIEKVITGNQTDWVQNTAIQVFDFSKRLLIPNISIDTNKLFYSGVLPYTSKFRGVSSEISIDSTNRIVKITSINNSILGLYYLSCDKDSILKYPKARSISIKDKAKLVYDKSYGYRSEWNSKNQFCYELVWPTGDDLNIHNALDKMRADLDAYFGLTSTIKFIPTAQYVLNKINIVDEPSTQIQGKQARSVPLSEFIDMLNIDQKTLPLIINNHASETDKVKINYDSEQKIDLNILNSMLSPIGFILKQEIRKQPIFELRDN